MQSMRLSTLINEDKLKKKVEEIGAEISEKFPDEELVAVCVLNGSFIFYSDLIRAIDNDVVCEFLGASSYEDSMESSGEVKLTLDLAHPVKDKHVLLIEDIVDTGLTMNYLVKHLEARRPKTLTTISLLLKPDALKEECKLDFVGFEIPNNFVVGYGLDFQGHYRNMPYIAQIENMN